MAKKLTAKCPQCGLQLVVTAPDNVNQGSVKCTKCGHVFTVTFPQTATFQQPPQTPFSEDTTILPSGGTMEEPGVVTFNGQPFPLDIGQNIVGRAAASSPANVQVPTPDIYCSRQHVIITVVRMPDNSLCTYIRNFKNKNTTLINGKQLQEGEEIALNEGDRIRMADTIIEFHKKR